MKQMKTLKERVQWCLDHYPGRHTSKIGHAKLMGVARHTLYLWLDGTSKEMTPEVSRKAAEHFQVDRLWLETGEGVPRPLAAKEESGRYRGVTKIIRDELDMDPEAMLHKALKALHVIDDDEAEVMQIIRQKSERATKLLAHLKELEAESKK